MTLGGPRAALRRARMQALVVQVMIRIGKRPARNCHPITIASLSCSPLAITSSAYDRT